MEFPNSKKRGARNDENGLEFKNGRIVNWVAFDTVGSGFGET